MFNKYINDYTHLKSTGMRTIIIALICCLCPISGVVAQSEARVYDNSENRLAIKTNLLYLASTTINAGVEVKLSNRLSLDLPIGYNPWKFSNNTQYKHFIVQPELRYWLNRTFYKSFVGLHASYVNYNLKGLAFPFGPYPSVETNRFDGHSMGVGLTYGYQFYADDKWNLEASIGLGYSRHKYDEYASNNNYTYFRTVEKDHFGILKVGFSISYFLN